ncbi:Reticulon-4 receptor-like 1 Nogo receptor-like 2 Nogo-66 receptor-like protein 2 [Larimichthys crocea]|uniref:Reticulon-4 receptor-like 1 Nogo receptor-like 2 Nogo-66 receptor-like protein 2 n=1 Tax=Larimichthys crocea TaxID=215358 RepID=A0A6G0I7X9_LARCR|nr:Reticulon-4 receptor-like 1 Nogo receptor-like 2 Nogo-66 receptor-like protein 2 [Larimichthys crocea]
MMTAVVFFPLFGRKGYGGVELLLVLCGLDLSLPCPRHCICYTSPSTVSCQAHNFHAVPEGIPAQSERVFLQNNKIQRLLRGHFSPTTTMLWLYSNNISYIQPSTFHGFDRLEELDLGDNKHLKAIASDTFLGLGRLHALHLYHCGLITLPPGIFAGLHNLQYLYLQDNQLEFLEDDLFIDLLNLSHLFLHGNKLWSLRQNTFRGLGVLDRLLLHQNRIQWVDRQAFHDLRRLTTLYLFNNSLTELSGGSLTLLPALEYLRLNDNPWECDCKALSLWDWLRRFRGSTSSLNCVSPPELAGKDLKTVKKEELPSCLSGEGHARGGPGREMEQGESLNHLNGHRNNNNHYLPHGDQYSLPSPSTLPRPPKGSRRNCTRRKGKGALNEVQVLQEEGKKDYTPDEGKYDLSGTTRRKNKCIPRTSVGPPSGVQRANNKAESHLADYIFCLPSALLLSLISVILC